MSEFALFEEGRSGFRLESMELYNWGTFGSSVWSFPFGGENALVTGDIGSGKSTWVDALTTLIVPPQRIIYNKAAGAERRERSDRSYLLGEYRSSRGEGAAYSTPVTLRDEKCYSVLIAVFSDAAASRLISLAQLRWLKAGEVQKVYVSSGRRLAVLADFGDFDGDGAAFRRKLRASGSTEVFETYSDYAAAFRSAIGISDKALDLFNQTLSMKTIGDLDDFIRNQMLEQPPARERLARILSNFDNLRAAHDAVEVSRRQRDALLPIDRDAREHEELASSIEELRSMSQALPFRAIALGVPLLEREIAALRLDLEAARASLESLRAQRAAKDEARASLRSAIDNSEAGRRIREIEAELEQTGIERDRRRAAADRLRESLGKLKRAFPASAEAFVALRAELEADVGRIADDANRLGEERDERLIERNKRRDEVEAAQVELDSLRRRTTSIPAQEIRLRRDLAEAVGATEAELPFAGELIRVRSDERKWEGAAERVLRPFALSLLVPENLYRPVSEYVRGTRLGARIVYYRVPEKLGEPPRLPERSLARVLEVKPSCPFRAWLEAELARRAGYARCEDMERFYRETDAITPEGLVKSGSIRHEKDDRPKVADPRNFVLGWSNREKIALLEGDLAERRGELEIAERRFSEASRDIAALESKRSAAAEALRTESFEQVDVDFCVARYRELREEKDSLEASSDQLAGLKAALDEAQKELARIEAGISAADQRLGAINSELARRGAELESAKANMESPASKEACAWFEKIDAFAGGEYPDLAGIDGWRAQVAARLESRRNTQERKDSDARGSLLKRMHDFLAGFPERQAELSAGVDFAQDFRALLGRIERDDLPSYEGRFRELLRESTLRDIALFHTELDEDARAIKEAIGIINEPLSRIEYNPGTYIALAAELNADQAVKDFRAELRRCLENTGAEAELYSEERFLRVKNLLSRLGGAESADRSWTEHVIDARSWFAFTASERWREDNSEKEFYSSSSGKSGGQKEKLAYTILATALAYQYGQGARRANGGFRLVVIDEAFGRGSEESTRYGLRLFDSLDLQLILVTPLQKIGIIEGSVATIHFIANPTGSASEVRSLGIKEYESGKSSRENAKGEP
jgi:Uncharacterized protein conserved in bacteria